MCKKNLVLLIDRRSSQYYVMCMTKKLYISKILCVANYLTMTVTFFVFVYKTYVSLLIKKLLMIKECSLF